MQDIKIENLFEIEDLIEKIALCQKKIDYLNALKKHRVMVLDDKISDIQDQMAEIKNVILTTMQTMSPNEKTLEFPAIGKVTRRKTKPVWQVENSDKLLTYLLNKGFKNDVVDTFEKINKKKLDDVLNRLSKETDEIPGVSLSDERESLSISFDSEFKPKEPPEKPEPSKPTSINVDDMADLNI